MLSFERHYSSLNYYRRQAKRWNINPTKIPDLRFNGYTKTFIRQQVIDGGPYREEWGYKFESIDSQNTKTEFLMPFVTREEFLIDTLRFTFFIKEGKPEMEFKKTDHITRDCGDLEFKSKKDFNVEGTEYKIYKYCYKTSYPPGTIIENQDYSGTVFYSEKFGVISSTDCYPGFRLELSNKKGGRILKMLEKDIHEDLEFSRACTYRKRNLK